MKRYSWAIVVLLTGVLLISALPYCKKADAQVAQSLTTKVVPLPDLILTCDPDSFKLICNRYEEDIYVMATLRIGKQVWKGVRLRVRGDTSRSFVKKSLKLKIPKGKNLPFDRDDINLNAEYLDKTYMRQHLATRLFQDAGQPCYKTSHLKVHLNGTYQGIYLLVENVEKDFLKRSGMSSKGDLFKATKDHACLSRHELVRKYWERKCPKKDTTWAPLESLIKVLNETPDADYARMAHAVFSYQNMVNAIAMNMLVGNRSTYYHNYFMYRSPEKHQWRYLPWDMDKTFILAEVDDEYDRGNLADSHSATMESNPFFERALAIPEIFSDIQRRVEELSTTIFTAEHLFPIIDSMAIVLASEILQDTLYHHQTMLSWQEEIAQIKTYILQRPLQLRNQFAHNPTSFQLLQPEGLLVQPAVLRWHPSHDPDDDRLTYIVAFSQDPKFPVNSTSSYIGLQDTFMKLPEFMAPGKYYWKVLADDQLHKTRGFDTYATFEIPAR
jgi:CotH kinase protein